MMNRKEMLKVLAGVPFLGSIAGMRMLGSDKKEEALKTRNLFKELGVTPIINATTTMTFLSGSRMLPEVMQAINSTSHRFANMYDLQDKVGKKIAEMLNCEDAMVTSGAAGALVLGTAACITGKDQKKIHQLPNNLPGATPEVIIQKSHLPHYPFSHSIRQAGIKFVAVEGSDQMERAINKNTVMAHYFNAARKSSISREQFIAIGKKHDIPTFNDAAADYPPKENLFKYTKMGFDLVTFSGGKMLRGPQSAGLLLGRKDLIEAAKLNDSPHEAPIGRPMKVNKEEIFGMYAALKHVLERDDKVVWNEWLDRCKRITAHVSAVPTVKGETHINPGPANAFPGLRISWDQNQVKITPEEVSKKLKAGRPSIIAGGRGDYLHIGVVLLNPEEVHIVANRVKQILQGHAI